MAGGEPVFSQIEAWQARSAFYRSLLEEELDYSLSEAEKRRTAELPELLSRLDDEVQAAAGGEGDPDALVARSVGFFARLSELQNDREETFFVSLRPLDRLICAGKAVLEGRAEATAVHRRVEPAVAEVSALKNLFRPNAGSFPRAFGEEMEEGFGLLDQAFADLEQYRREADEKLLERALAAVNSGGRRVARFPQAIQDVQEQSRRRVPLIGTLLQTLEEQPDSSYLTLLRRQGLPELVQMWRERDDGWLVAPEVADQVLGDVDEALQRFEEATGEFEVDPDSFWEAANRLEDAFRAVRDSSMPVQDILDSSLGPEASLLLALLEGRAPDYSARVAVEAMRAGEVPAFIEELADGLEEYLKSRDKVVLLEMLEMLLEQVR